MAQIRKMQQMCYVDCTVTGVVAYVIKNVFSHVRNTDSDMSSKSAAGKLLYTVGPRTANSKLLPLAKKNSNYSLWDRSHNLTLSSDVSVTKRRNFIYRMLFTDIY